MAGRMKKESNKIRFGVRRLGAAFIDSALALLFPKAHRKGKNQEWMMDCSMLCSARMRGGRLCGSCAKQGAAFLSIAQCARKFRSKSSSARPNSLRR